jgi:hypothetical protein
MKSLGWICPVPENFPESVSVSVASLHVGELLLWFVPEKFPEQIPAS